MSLTRGGALAASAAFALPFTAAAVFVWYMVGLAAVEAWEARDWVKIKADVVSADLSSRTGRSSTTWRAVGTYRYEFGGRTYESSRLGVGEFGSGGDNIGDWQEEMASYLRQARDEKRPIMAWVNPDDPAQAVVDRDVRWGMMALLLPFAVLFAAIGLGGLYAMYRVATVREWKKPAAKKKRGKAARRGVANGNF